MANYVKVAMQQRIITLYEIGWSCRKIARELGVHRDTVRKYVRLARENSKSAIVPPGSGPPEDSKPAIVPAGSEPFGDSKPAIVPAGSSGRPSQCKPYRTFILSALEKGLSAQRVWQDLQDEYDFPGGYDSVKRYVRRLSQANPLPFRRMESAPGTEAQLDLGAGAFVQEKLGKRRRPHVLRVVLSHSRKGYSEVIYKQTTENFIRVLENAFWYFGGAIKTIVIDNLKAAVKNADWFDPELNPKIQSFAAHYGIVFLPTKPYTPRHKGKIESGIGYVKKNALKGRTFASLEEQNHFLLEWEERVADTRIHGTTRKQVGKIFEEVERPALRPLPEGRFPFFHEGERTVHRDGHIEVDRAYYSVPPEYLGRKVLVRWDSRLVRIFTGQFRGHLKQIAVHVKAEPGRFRTDTKHIPAEKVSMVERGAGYLLKKARLIGPQTGAWAEAMLKHRGIPGVRVLVGLLSLTRKYTAREMESACAVALSHGGFKLRILRKILQRQVPPQEQFEFIDRHPIIREMREYGRLPEVKFSASGAETTFPSLSPPSHRARGKKGWGFGKKGGKQYE